MNGRQALNLQPGDRVVRGPLGGKVTSKTRMFVAIRWDDGTRTSTHRYDMKDINRPSPPKSPPGNTVAIIESIQNGEIYSDIAKRYGVTKQRVQFIAKQAGIHRHQKPKRRQVIDALQAGEDYTCIAEKIGVSIHYVDQTALNEGLREDRRWREPRPPTERNVTIIAALKEGATYSEIAKQHGLSYQRIQQIAKKYGIPNVSRINSNARYQSIIEVLKNDKTLKYKEVAERLEVSVSTVCKLAHEHGLNSKERENVGPRNKNKSEIARLVKETNISYIELAKQFGLSLSRISFIAKEYNIQRRDKKNAAIIAAVKAGESYESIGKRYNLTTHSIRRIARRLKKIGRSDRGA